MKVLSESCFRYSEAGPFFAEVKDDLDMAQDGYVSPIEYFMVVYPEDLEIARMYPDINEAKGVNIRVYRPEQNA